MVSSRRIIASDITPALRQAWMQAVLEGMVPRDTTLEQFQTSVERGDLLLNNLPRRGTSIDDEEMEAKYREDFNITRELASKGKK